MDDSCANDGRSLPMSKWMRRNDRVDFMDMCASSPPSDGFFYAGHSRITSRQQGCEQQKTEKKVQPEATNTNLVECNNSQQSGFFKSLAPVTSKGGDMGSTKEKSGRILNMDSAELEHWAKQNIRGEIIHANDDSAPTPVDHVPQFQRVVPIITKTEEGNSSSSGPVRFADKLPYTPDITPSSTPGVTPACSPQISRKMGNPFFAGDPSRKEEGSWLFRPGPKADNMMYEAKVEIQPATGTQPGTRNVRYVPRPSQLRELNFFSPTSM